MKICTQCRYYVPQSFLQRVFAGPREEFADCRHPASLDTDIYSGKTRYMMAQYMRLNKCGREGVLFEEKGA